MKKFTLLMLVGLLSTTFCFGQAQEGDTVPNFQLTDIQGVTWDFHETLDSGYVILLDFMASWCGPCASSTPTASQINTDFGMGSDFVKVWALDIEPGDSDATIQSIKQQWGSNYNAFGQARSVYDFYFGSSSGYCIPWFSVVRSDHTVGTYSECGFGGALEQNLRDAIEADIKPKAMFTSDMDPNDGVTFMFNADDTKFSHDYNWDFGDGTTSTEKNPTHTFSTNGTFNVTLTGSNSYVTDTDSHTETVHVTNVGIANVNPVSSKFRVSPNPASNNFELNFESTVNQDFTINMYNVKGQMVYTEVVNNFDGKYTRNIDVMDLPAGLYNVQVVTESTTLQQRVVVQ